MAKRFAIALAGLAAVAAIAPAAAQNAGVPCQGRAFVIDPDPRGVNVRAAPAADARIVATLPKDKEETMVRLAAESGGWFRIDEAFRFSDGRIVDVSGWVHGSRLGVGAREMDILDNGSLVLRAEPHAQAGTVATLSWELRDGKVTIRETRPGEPPHTIGVRPFALALAACRGDWMKVKLPRSEGWVPKSALCGNPTTTCS